MLNKLETNTVLIGIKKKISEEQYAVNIRGTGVLLKNGRLVTCAHIYSQISDDEKKSIFCGVPINIDGKNIEYSSFDIKISKLDDKHDLALFEVLDFGKHTENFGIAKSDFMTITELEAIERTKEAHFIGFPLANEFLQMGLGITLSASECSIGAVKYTNEGVLDFILIDKLVNPGNSGSPLYIGKKIVGLTSGTFNQTHKIGDALINVPVSLGIVRTSNYIRDIIL